jgi:hypothetical protein
LTKKEEQLDKIQVSIQEKREVEPPSIATPKVDTMIETNLVSSPSLEIPQDNLGEFEMHTKGIGSKLLREMGYNGQGLGRRRKDIISPIVVESGVKPKSLGFNNGEEKAMNNKITFVKEKDTKKLVYSSKERATTNEESQ